MSTDSSQPRLGLAWMSLWDKYFAPGDVRRRQHLEAQQQEAQDAASRETEELQKKLNKTTVKPRIDAAHRQRRQDGTFFGGIVFTCLSLLITRRSMQRKRIPFPKTFTPSNAPPPRAEGSIDAAEALVLATFNVFSFGMLVAGGTMKFLDIADVEDLREGVRRGVGYDVYGGESEGDKEIEAWVADVLSRKDAGGGLDLKGSIAEKLRELEEMEKKRKEKGEGR